MAYKKKTEREKDFVDYILMVGGIDSHIETIEGSKNYFEFRLKNGTRRYWTNMSDENLKRLGIEAK